MVSHDRYTVYRATVFPDEAGVTNGKDFTTGTMTTTLLHHFYIDILVTTRAQERSSRSESLVVARGLTGCGGGGRLFTVQRPTRLH
jgi:hypothetical protein